MPTSGGCSASTWCWRGCRSEAALQRSGREAVVVEPPPSYGCSDGARSLPPSASRDDVDRLHAHLQKLGQKLGATILDAPADYPQYRAGYYALFFADPDGLKLEYAYTPADPDD
jgi:hypothetical protein